MDRLRWRRLMEQWRTTAHFGVYDALLAAHSAPGRHYHNAAHVADCLAELDGVQGQITAVSTLELALWFHDAVYNPRSPTNETDSAAWARRFLLSIDAAPDRIDDVVALIMHTRHAAVPLTGDAAFMVDIDLAILGRPPAQYAAYEEAIRQEYAWVPRDIFRRKRAEILAGFLTRPAIFQTAIFRRRYEQQARRNLQAAITRLRRSE